MREYIELIRNYPDFRNLWFARLVSMLGDWFNLLASAQLIAQLTNSGMAVSGLFLARFLPLFFATPFAGVVADRVSRRTIMIATDVARVGVVLCFLLIRDPSQIWLFYLLTALQFVLSAFYTPAHSSLIANVVPPDRLVAANTLDALSWSVMLSVGALLGGVATALLGVQMAFILDAATFAVSAFFLMRIRVKQTVATSVEAMSVEAMSVEAMPVEGMHVQESGLTAFRDGLRYLRLRPYLLVIALVKAGGAIVWGAINVLEIPMANTTFAINGSGAWTLGIIYALVGLGTGVGPLLFGKVLGESHKALLRGIGIGFIVFTVGAFWIGLANRHLGLFGAISLRALGTGALWVFSAVLLQSFVRDEFRGRVFGFELAALTLCESIGTLYGGIAIDRFGMDPQTATLYAAVLCLVITLVWYAFQRKAITALANQRSFATPRIREVAPEGVG